MLSKLYEHFLPLLSTIEAETHLFSCHRVLEKRDMRKSRQVLQRVQVRKLNQIVCSENQIRKIRDRTREVRLDARDSIPC